jgi:hypothetical protein
LYQVFLEIDFNDVYVEIDSKLGSMKIGKAEEGAVGDGPLSGETAHFNEPAALTCDSFGNLYVAGLLYHRRPSSVDLIESLVLCLP